MKKLVIKDTLVAAIEEAQVPSVGADEVLIKVYSISVCGSDIHLFRGTYNGPRNYPILFGHEWAGEVVECGSKVTKLKKGDRVTGDCSKYCGTCSYCKIDKNVCEHIEKFGITVDGASAELIVRKEKYLYALPDGLDFSLGSLTEPLAVSANLIARIRRLAKDIGDKRILICGAAGIGLGAALQLKYQHGCQDITILEISDFRRNMAQRIGFKTIATLDKAAEGDGYSSLYGKDNFDIIIETTGSAKVFPLVFDRIKPLGVIGTLGMLPEVGIPQKLIVLKALTVIGSIGGTGYFHEVIDFINRHKGDIAPLITQKFKLFDIDSLEKGFEVASRSDGSIKVQFEA